VSQPVMYGLALYGFDMERAADLRALRVQGPRVCSGAVCVVQLEIELLEERCGLTWLKRRVGRL
jgi:hypothetical protein